VEEDAYEESGMCGRSLKVQAINLRAGGKMKRTAYLVTILILLVTVTSAWGAISGFVSYQGMISDNEGNPVTDTLNLTFTIYNDSLLGNPENIMWQETHPSVSVIDGLFQVIFGQGIPAVPISDEVFSEADRWVGVSIQGSPEQTPRTRFTCSPYAYRISTVDGAAGGTISGDLSVNGKASIGIGVTNTGLNAFAVGENVSATGDHSTVAGGINNTASGADATVGGGRQNTASGQSAVISGGYAGTANNENSTIGGGWHNVASGVVSTIAGGQEDTASGTYSTVSGGYGNVASGFYGAIGGGFRNSASGVNATVPGGRDNNAVGEFTLAAGHRAKALHSGSFVWADSIDSDFASTGSNQFIIRASGGVGVNTNTPTAALHVNGEAKSVVGGAEFYMVPRGAIIMWSGAISDIPSGWALCDGTNGTPDLRNRFILACQPGEDPGEIGGASSHYHTVDIGPFSTGVPNNYWRGANLLSASDCPTYDHIHTVNPPPTNTDTKNNIPPYYKLAFIMRL
jgi:hypothetical protein